MRRRISFFLGLALLCCAAGMVMAQARHITPFTGTWKMNPAKSRFNPGPPFRSFTLTFTPDGTRKLDLVRANSESFLASLPWSDGKEVSVVTAQPSTNLNAVSKIRGRSFHDTWKENGKIIEKVHGVLSPDGVTLIITIDGTDSQDRPFHNRLQFDKQ